MPCAYSNMKIDAMHIMVTHRPPRNPRVALAQCDDIPCETYSSKEYILEIHLCNGLSSCS